MGASIMKVAMVLMWALVAANIWTTGGVQDPCPEGMATVAMGMMSCLPATQNTSAQPDAACCTKLAEMSGNPACLCACLTSPLARAMAVDPIVALSIPKRCDIDSRPVGYRCAGGSVP